MLSIAMWSVSILGRDVHPAFSLSQSGTPMKGKWFSFPHGTTGLAPLGGFQGFQKSQTQGQQQCGHSLYGELLTG